MEKLKQQLEKLWLKLYHRDRVQLELNDFVKAKAEAFFAGRDEDVKELQQRIADLEAAYPDYNKAKEKAEADQKNEVVPGFRPFSQRKRGWENAHRKTADKKEQSGSV